MDGITVIEYDFFGTCVLVVDRYMFFFVCSNFSNGLSLKMPPWVPPRIVSEIGPHILMEVVSQRTDNETWTKFLYIPK